MARRVLVLGGGVGGVVAARRLSQVLSKKGEYEVILVSAESYFDFKPLYVDVALHYGRVDELRVPLKGLEKYKVRVIIDRVKRVDPANRLVVAEGSSYEYDYLVISLGVRYGWEEYPGLERAGYHNYTLEGAIELAEAISRFKRSRLLVLVPEVPHRCGIYPYEIATQLAQNYRKLGRDIRVTLMVPKSRMFQRFGPDVERAWMRMLEETGVEYVLHSGLEEVDPEKRVVRAGNVEERYDLLIKIPPSRLPEPLAVSEGFQCKDDPRWSPVRPRTFQHPKYDDVFLVGEHSMPSAGLPSAGAPVHYAANLASEVILNDIIGGYPVLGYYKTVYCVTYYGVGGLAMGAEVFYDEETGKWDFTGYTITSAPMARLLKEAYYRGFVRSLA